MSMTGQFTNTKRLAGMVLAGTALAACLAIGVERAAAFRGGGFGGFHGGGFGGFRGGGFGGFHGGGFGGFRGGGFGGFHGGGFGGFHDGSFAGGGRFGDGGFVDRGGDAGFGRGGWGSVHNAGTFSDRADTFDQSHPEFHQNATQFQQNRFNEANQLQTNRTTEANYLQGQRQATWNNYNGNWGGYYGGLGLGAGFAIGATVAALPAAAAAISVAGNPYYYANGVYYASQGGQYAVVPPPQGAVVTSPPSSCSSVNLGGGGTGLDCGGAFYAPVAGGYQVIPPPIGATTWTLPSGAVDPGYVLPVNRGAAYLDGLLYRGTEDGRVLAYDFKTGSRVWETAIADPKKNEVVPAAPIAWQGLVFIGNAGGDQKGAKGRMYALEAKTGKIVWEFFLVPKSEGDTVRGPQGASPLDNSTWKNIPGAPISGGGTWTSSTLDPAAGLLYVPGGNPAPDYDNSVRQGENLYTDSVVVLDAKTGAYKNHFQLVPRDWHDWDVSNPPALIRTMGGKRLMAVAPKDGFLYGFDLADDKLLYRTPVTTIENVDEPFSTDKEVHFCPGAGGGEEWNSPAYNPRTNLILTGDVDWCTTVKLQTKEEIVAMAAGQFWTGERSLNPFNEFGKFARADGHWSGWLHAVDAVNGQKL
jgi:outer membrane protein assembly factor BamB